ncbi:MAG: gluconate 2-dehydrogenase subunit 3 family protein [Acidobacteria bacterium]|nr:gluconate 2-dehydrogenase subunit 3 family protein [Acidobacteriota bacterium]
MSKFTRRTLVQISALPLAAQAQHDHGPALAAVSSRTGFFTDHEFTTLKALCDLIIPADEVSPAASAAGAAEYIELLSSRNGRLAQTFRGGLAWLNAQVASKEFVNSAIREQTALLDRICDRRRAAPSDKPGADFFDWARRMTIDAFYTHPAGYKDVDYRGGKGMTQFSVPAEALEQALKKANLK